jgi:NAD(P)-dependent dehydrogenase (short-subunit alcohol dehydrogenase family)
MKDLRDKIAVITGAGSGIGRGTALALAEAGMDVVIADIDEASATSVAGEITELGRRSLVVPTDVTDPASVETLAEKAISEFGGVHVLHNNAGVAVFLRLDEMSDADWDFQLGANIRGVVNGLQAFLPRLKAQEGEKHIVNTGSMAGMIAPPGLGAYSATKFAVVAISEALRFELASENIGVSVLCPGVVATNLVDTSTSRRPAGGVEMASFDLDPSSLGVIMPEQVGQLVRQAIERNDLYIFTHPELGPAAKARFDAILAAFDEAASRGTA